MGQRKLAGNFQFWWSWCNICELRRLSL